MRKSWFCFVLCLFCQLTTAQEWHLIKKKRSIQIYSSPHPNSKELEYKAVTLYHGAIEDVVDLLLNGDRLKEWNHKAANSKLIRKISKYESVVWLHTHFPWPLHDRDHVARLRVHKTNARQYHILIEPELKIQVPITPNTIRLTKFKGSWTITAEDNHITIEQQFWGELESSLPYWLVRKFVVSAILHNFENLLQLLKKDTQIVKSIKD